MLANIEMTVGAQAENPAILKMLSRRAAIKPGGRNI
jgi:hypothetical protein